jgi:hypothetical protein
MEANQRFIQNSPPAVPMSGAEASERRGALVGISGNWEKRRVETFERLGSIARRSFVSSILTWAADFGFGGRPLSQRQHQPAGGARRLSLAGDLRRPRGREQLR